MTGVVGTTGARSGEVGTITKSAMSEGGTGASALPSGTEAQRPASPETGYTRMNTTSGSLEFWDGTLWISTNLIPELSLLSGAIYDSTGVETPGSANSSAGYTTLATNNIAVTIINSTDEVDITFKDSSGVEITTIESVAVTAGVATLVIPALVTAKTGGDVISVSVANKDGTPSSNSLNSTMLDAWSGGTVTMSGDYRVHTFLTTANFIVPASKATGYTYDYMVVAAGGGGSSRHGGGGGAGGLVHVTGTNSIPAGTYSMSVGAASARALGDGAHGVLGSSSTAFGETAVRGGASGGYYPTGCIAANYNGGSGCGASDRQCNTAYGWDLKGAGNSTQIAAVASYSGTGNSYGFRGGSTTYSHAGGGGGGASQQGATGSQTQSGTGGHGRQINFDGNNWYWSGGGGGNRWGDQTTIYGGSGGNGGGGGGAAGTGGAAGPGPGGGIARNTGTAGNISANQSGGDAGTNTGGGGGGGAGNITFVGGASGSGIIQVKYKAS